MLHQRQSRITLPTYNKAEFMNELCIIRLKCWMPHILFFKEREKKRLFTLPQNRRQVQNGGNNILFVAFKPLREMKRIR